MLPEKLFKPRPKGSDLDIDPKRIKKILRFQGVFNVLLFIALISSWAWFLRIENSVTYHALAEDFDPPVRVTMPLYLYGEDRRLSVNDIVEVPFVTVYGKIEEFANLQEILDGFSVHVRKTKIAPNLRSGEFAEKLALKPGKNEIDVTLSWGGSEKYRYSYSITYVKPQTTQESEQSGELLIP
jgi:hypothetical protein